MLHALRSRCLYLFVGGSMKIGDLVEYIAIVGAQNLGIVIDYNYHPQDQCNEALVLWSDGSSAWYFERRLTIITNKEVT